MKKQFLSLLLAAGLFAFPLAACAESAPKEGGNAPQCPEQTAPELDPPAATEPPAMPEEPAVATYVSVLANGLNVRTGAGTSYASLGQVEKGVLLARGAQRDGWFETQFRNRKAYVSADPRFTALTTLEEGCDEAERVIAQGLKVLGTPYVYGAIRLHDGSGRKLSGFSEDRFDCSSLMQYIFYFGADILLDMNTRTQIRQGRHVEQSELRRGDLMFFTNDARRGNAGIERVGHVALYLGDNYILHTASDYAKIEQISAKRWSYFLEARRMF